jgi:hypothetical protein
VVVVLRAAVEKTSSNARLTLSTLQGFDEPTATRTIMSDPGVSESGEVVWLFILFGDQSPMDAPPHTTSTSTPSRFLKLCFLQKKNRKMTVEAWCIMLRQDRKLPNF